MDRTPVPMTPQGHRRLQEELKRLKSVERPKIVAEVEAALAHGDISENAEYDAAKEKQAQLHRRIGEVENKLSLAQVIDTSRLSHDRVAFGAKVKLADVNNGGQVEYQIVGADEGDVKQGLISISSPIARALIGKEVGEVVKVRVPNGDREYEILDIH